MAALSQLKAVARLTGLGWRSVGIPYDDPVNERRVGGPVTMMNASGDVAKVFSDGKAQVHRASDWLTCATETV